MSTFEDQSTSVGVATKTTRRRGETLTRAIHEATLAELQDNGYAGVTFGGVAQRAQTSRSVLHRRYPSRVHLVVDALLSIAPTPPPIVTSGSLREDLYRIAENAAIPQRHFGPEISRRILGVTTEDLDADLVSASYASIRTALPHVMSSARARGELGPAEIPSAALNAPLIMVRSEGILREVSTGFLEQVVDEIAMPLCRATSNRPPGTACARAAQPGAAQTQDSGGEPSLDPHSSK